MFKHKTYLAKMQKTTPKSFYIKHKVRDLFSESPFLFKKKRLNTCNNNKNIKHYFLSVFSKMYPFKLNKTNKSIIFQIFTETFSIRISVASIYVITISIWLLNKIIQLVYTKAYNKNILSIIN